MDKTSIVVEEIQCFCNLQQPMLHLQQSHILQNKTLFQDSSFSKITTFLQIEFHGKETPKTYPW